MFAPAPALRLTIEERGELETIARDARTGQKVALSAGIILLGADGVPNAQIADRPRVSRRTVILQRKRFGQLGLRALLKDASRRPGRASVSEDLVQQIVDATRTVPLPGATQWTARSSAAWAGTSRMVVHRIWKRHGLQPHRVGPFKVSHDPQRAAKVRDVVGLYLDPPDRALVLSVDEKTSIQALDRTQPGLPLKKGRCATQTHGYKRNGTTTLYAALNVLDGKVIGHCVPRCCAKAFIKFPAKIDGATPRHLDLHVIVDNSSTHKTPEVQRWLQRHRRFDLHFTPTSGSWLNWVESWFAMLTKQRLRRGVFRSLPELIAAIDDYLRVYNATPTHFAWTKDADAILAKIERARRAMTRHTGK